MSKPIATAVVAALAVVAAVATAWQSDRARFAMQDEARRLRRTARRARAPIGRRRRRAAARAHGHYR